MAKLNKIKVAYISLVKNPANKLDIIYKSTDAKFTDQKLITITKNDPEGLVYGTVYEPLVKDTDGDWADAATIQQAAHDFLTKGATSAVDHEHSEKTIGANVVESHINEKGAWEVVIKMDPKSDTFQKVQKGEIKGLSMGALCQKSEEEPPKKEESQNSDITKAINDLAVQIQKMSSDIDKINQKVDKVPKSRQMHINGDDVKITKDDEDAPLKEFDFSNLK